MPEAHEADALLLNIDGYEGPIDVLLWIWRAIRKWICAKFLSFDSILCRQYLAFVDRQSRCVWILRLNIW